jgi:hypothetical protein
MGAEVEKRKSHSQDIDLQKGVTLVAKNKSLKLAQLFFGDPNISFVVEEVYESNGRKFCKTTDITLEFPEGKKGQIHVASFLNKNFKPSSSTQSSKK